METEIRVSLDIASTMLNIIGGHQKVAERHEPYLPQIFQEKSMLLTS